MSKAPAGIRYAGIGDEAGAGLAEQIAAITALGWGQIELRNADGTALADLDDRSFDQLVEALAAAGLETACVDSRIGGWARPVSGPLADDLAELEVLARRCPTLGTRYVRVMSYPNDHLDESHWRATVLDRIRVLTQRAEQAGLILLHENCSGWAGRHGDRMLDLLDAADSPALRLLFDTGNGVAYDYKAYDLLTEIVEHVAHVHVKDAVGEAENPVYTLPGEGDCRLADCLRLLLERGYTGTWSIEPHLRVRPHEHLSDAGADGVQAYIEYGRRLERLVREQVLTARAK